MAFDYAVTKASNIKSKFIQGSTDQSLDIGMPKTRVTNIFVAPKFKFPIVPTEFFGLGDALTFAPGYSCQRLSTLSSLNSCGSDLHLYSSQEKDGHKFFEIQFKVFSVKRVLTLITSFGFLRVGFTPTIAANIYTSSKKCIFH